MIYLEYGRNRRGSIDIFHCDIALGDPIPKSTPFYQPNRESAVPAPASATARIHLAGRYPPASMSTARAPVSSTVSHPDNPFVGNEDGWREETRVETRKLLLRRQAAANGPPMIRITLLAEDSRETVLKVENDLVEDSATVLEQELARWAQAPKVVVDLAGVRFIDEAGIHVLRQAGGRPASSCADLLKSYWPAG